VLESQERIPLFHLFPFISIYFQKNSSLFIPFDVLGQHGPVVITLGKNASYQRSTDGQHFYSSYVEKNKIKIKIKIKNQKIKKIQKIKKSKKKKNQKEKSKRKWRQTGTNSAALPVPNPKQTPPNPPEARQSSDECCKVVCYNALAVAYLDCTSG